MCSSTREMQSLLQKSSTLGNPKVNCSSWWWILQKNTEVEGNRTLSHDTSGPQKKTQPNSVTEGGLWKHFIYKFKCCFLVFISFFFFLIKAYPDTQYVYGTSMTQYPLSWDAEFIQGPERSNPKVGENLAELEFNPTQYSSKPNIHTIYHRDQLLDNLPLRSTAGQSTIEVNCWGSEFDFDLFCVLVCCWILPPTKERDSLLASGNCRTVMKASHTGRHLGFRTVYGLNPNMPLGSCG